MDSSAPGTGPDVDFPIAWEPDDEELEWEWDDMHMPRAIPPLSEDYVAALMAGIVYRYRAMGLPATIPVRVWNGYTYFALKIDAPADQHEALMARGPEMRRTLIPGTAAYWGRVLPELQSIYREIDAVSGDEPRDELVAAWDRVWTMVERAWQIHFHVITGPYQVLDDLADRYEALVAGGTAAEALELVAGAIPELHDVETGLEALVEAARRAPDVAARLHATPVPDLAAIAGLSGSGQFVAAVAAFLARHGHLGHVREDLMEPSWHEDQRPLLVEIGRRLGRTGSRAVDRWPQRAAAAEARADVVRSVLAERPDELAEFEALLATAREIGPLTEGHNYWIDRMIGDRLRRFTRRVGARLVTDGVLGDKEDVAYLRRAEIADLIGDPLDRRGLVGERRARHAWQATIRPPRKVGRVSESKPGAKADRFDGARFDPVDDRTLKGTGASIGIVRGPARVVHGPDDFERVQPGDIVVATASNPGWVPLFTIAGGFVTDAGGVLSHAAVVAREFGLVAVVGTGDATTRIADGQMIEIDGTTGLVRLE